MACEILPVDSMEVAIFKKGSSFQNLPKGWNLKWDYPFERLGKKILGLAYREGTCIGERPQDEQQLKFIGLLIFSDPIRSTAKKAIADGQAAGIRIKMSTGTPPLTAHAVADQTGIIHSHDRPYTGDQLAKITSEERDGRGAYLGSNDPS